MQEMTMPGEPGLLLNKPVIGMGSTSTATAAAAALVGDYTWSMIITTMACAVMVVVSAMKGVRAFSFALTYTNLWYIFGKKGRVRVRVHSFTSTNGSNCFVTTRGEFSAELVKEEEEETCEGVKQLDSSFDEKKMGNSLNIVKGPNGGSKAGCIVGTEMVFIYGNRASVFTTGSMAAARLSEKKCLTDASSKSVSSKRLKKRESFSRRAVAVRAAGELAEWQLGVVRGGNGNDCLGDSRMMVPKWALNLLEPLEIARFSTSMPLVQRNGVVSVAALMKREEHPWDAALKLRLAVAEGCSSRSRTDDGILYPSAVVTGATRTATLRKNVVKIWDNPTRSSISTLPVSTPNSFVSSFDLDWEKDIGFFGNSIGELSLWDFERSMCVTSLGAHMGSISSLHSCAADQLQLQGSCVLTAGAFAQECGGSAIRLWDSRALNSAAISTTARFSSVDDFKFRDYEIVARDGNSSISMHDIRMLNSSPVYEVPAGEVRSVRGEGDAQCAVPEEEKWWDAAVMVVPTGDEDDYCEDDWVTVDRETVKSSSSVLSRCLSALSSAISR